MQDIFPHQKVWKNLMLSLLILGLFSNFGCDNSFTPLKENENLVFSMFGVLDINADTQWVRVMPIGTTLLPSDTASNRAEVRLVRESTGATTILNDSLFQFNEDTFVWNYWTDVPIEPNENYTLIAENSEGAQSRVTVETPFTPVPLEVEYYERFDRIYLNGVETDSLVVVEGRYLVQPITDMGCGFEMEVVVPHIEEIAVRPDNLFYLAIEDGMEISQELGVGSFLINRRAIVVITATRSWPNVADLSEYEVALPDIISNVENGTGVVAGIARQEVEVTPRVPACIPN